MRAFVPNILITLLINIYLFFLFFIIFQTWLLNFFVNHIQNIQTQIHIQSPKLLYTAQYTCILPYKIIDGDTITVFDCNAVLTQKFIKTYKIRLALIDCPETVHSQQTYGMYAKIYLIKHILFRPQISLNFNNLQDKYSRQISLIFTFSGKLINQQLAKSGLCIYNSYDNDLFYNSKIQQSQHHAIKNHLGMWGE